MSQFNTGPVPGGMPEIRPGTDLYTVLLIIAAALLFGTTIYVAVMTQILFGSLLPPSGG